MINIFICRFLIMLVPLLHLIVQILVPIPVRLIPIPLAAATAKVEALLKLLMEREEATDPILAYLILHIAVDTGMVREKIHVQGILSKLAKREFFICMIHIHVLMLRRNFELILIKIGFFTNF